MTVLIACVWYRTERYCAELLGILYATHILLFYYYYYYSPSSYYVFGSYQKSLFYSSYFIYKLKSSFDNSRSRMKHFRFANIYIYTHTHTHTHIYIYK